MLAYIPCFVYVCPPPHPPTPRILSVINNADKEKVQTLIITSLLSTMRWHKNNKKYFSAEKNMLGYVLWIQYTSIVYFWELTIAYWLLTYTYQESNTYPFGLNKFHTFPYSILFWSFCKLVPRNHQLTRKRSPQSLCHHVHLHMMSCLSVLMLTVSTGKFEISTRDGCSISATRCQHLMVSDLDVISTRISGYFYMLSSSRVHIGWYSQLRQPSTNMI